MTSTGGAPTLSTTVDWTTNRITPTGVSYDLNGNMTAMPGSITLAYDVANRLTTVNGTQTYAYDLQNLRVYRRGATDKFFLYGVEGAKLGEFQITGYNGGQIQLANADQTTEAEVA